jgi:hypothetical protein
MKRKNYPSKTPKKFLTEKQDRKRQDEEQKLLANEIQCLKKPKTAKKPKRKKDPFYSSWEWRKLRLQVITEADGRCAICGRTVSDRRDDGISKVKITVDHIKRRSEHPELELVKTNLRCLCSDCHEALEVLL